MRRELLYFKGTVIGSLSVRCPHHVPVPRLPFPSPSSPVQQPRAPQGSSPPLPLWPTAHLWSRRSSITCCSCFCFTLTSLSLLSHYPVSFSFSFLFSFIEVGYWPKMPERSFIIAARGRPSTGAVLQLETGSSMSCTSPSLLPPLTITITISTTSPSGTMFRTPVTPLPKGNARQTATSAVERCSGVPPRPLHARNMRHYGTICLSPATGSHITCLLVLPFLSFFFTEIFCLTIRNLLVNFDFQNSVR